ncbi:MAG: GNAT family N-acetyltransferase [Rhodocyclales bacterium]|nr:GNAT family N-acetyltransferase [Rhodocyclales bacterium]
MAQKTHVHEVRLAQKPTMRVLKREDLDAIVEIDRLVSRQSRRNYYERKVAAMLDATHNINTSLVAEIDGRIVGFIMGDVYFGEFGIPETTGTIDTLGVHPDVQNHGVASELLEQFLMNMKAVGVSKVYTLVNWDDFGLEKFFSRHSFVPSKRINLEYKMP